MFPLRKQHWRDGQMISLCAVCSFNFMIFNVAEENYDSPKDDGSDEVTEIYGYSLKKSSCIEFVQASWIESLVASFCDNVMQSLFS